VHQPWQVKAKFEFVERMKVEAVDLLERLEAWAEKQAAAMDMGRNLDKLSQNFDSLLRVMDALYQVGCVLQRLHPNILKRATCAQQKKLVLDRVGQIHVLLT
jgi:hypothetical protein